MLEQARTTVAVVVVAAAEELVVVAADGPPETGVGWGAPLTPALAGGEGRQRLYAAAIRPVGAFARTLHPKRTYREESVVLSSYRRIHAVVVVVAVVVEPSSRSRRESKSKSKTNSRGTRKREREIEVRS